MAYLVNSTDKCPHCLTVVRFESIHLGQQPSMMNIASGASNFYCRTQGGGSAIQFDLVGCPKCGKLVMSVEQMMIYPRNFVRSVPGEVPTQIADDYHEAAAVMPISLKASAALSRRCLQTVLRDAGRVKHQDLSKEIDEAMKTLPSHIADQVDAIRNIGNFAAHPIKDTNSGSIVDVEPAEAEWNLDVLDLLFDFYYVQPAVASQKRQALNAKLQSVGKPSMKS